MTSIYMKPGPILGQGSYPRHSEILDRRIRRSTALEEVVLQIGPCVLQKSTHSPYSICTTILQINPSILLKLTHSPMSTSRTILQMKP
jgi:hypothetical protein